MTDPNRPRCIPVGDYVLGECGHTWRESRPEGFLIDPNQPRACTRHTHQECPVSLMPSPQDMAMVRVFYFDTRPEWWPW